MMRSATSLPGITFDFAADIEAESENRIYHQHALSLDLNKTLPRADPAAALDVHIVLDETGSMQSMGNEPVESVKAFIDIQRTGVPICISLTKFNLYMTTVYSSVPIADPVCDQLPYHPSSMTAAYDALRYVILSATTPLSIVFITDGEDNSSGTSRQEIHALIQRAKDCGWTFEFIGCNEESMIESQRMGMPSSQPLDTPTNLPELMRGTSNTLAGMNRARTNN